MAEVLLKELQDKYNDTIALGGRVKLKDVISDLKLPIRPWVWWETGVLLPDGDWVLLEDVYFDKFGLGGTTSQGLEVDLEKALTIAE